MNILNQPPIENRECGGCKACCTIMSVRELSKGYREPCANECEIGCAIYQERPTSCQTFRCFWLEGHIGGESHRPDKLGVMFTTIEERGEIVLNAYEVSPNAFDNDKVKYILGKLAEKIVFIIRTFDKNMKLMGRRKAVERFCNRHHL